MIFYQSKTPVLYDELIHMGWKSHGWWWVYKPLNCFTNGTLSYWW